MIKTSIALALIFMSCKSNQRHFAATERQHGRTYICYHTCDTFNINGWHPVYNNYYKKYAVINYSDEFLCKDYFGDYGIYGAGWMEKRAGTSCGDPSKSLFNNLCDAHNFVTEYFTKWKEDYWHSIQNKPDTSHLKRIESSNN